MLWVLRHSFLLCHSCPSVSLFSLFSGQGGDDSAKKKVSVVMEKVGDCSSEDKNSSFVFCLAVLSATTIH